MNISRKQGEPTLNSTQPDARFGDAFLNNWPHSIGDDTPLMHVFLPLRATLEQQVVRATEQDRTDRQHYRGGCTIGRRKRGEHAPHSDESHCREAQPLRSGREPPTSETCRQRNNEYGEAESEYCRVAGCKIPRNLIRGSLQRRAYDPEDKYEREQPEGGLCERLHGQDHPFFHRGHHLPKQVERFVYHDSPSSVSRIESSYHRPPTCPFSTVVKLCKMVALSHRS